MCSSDLSDWQNGAASRPSPRFHALARVNGDIVNSDRYAESFGECTNATGIDIAIGPQVVIDVVQVQ